MPMTTAYMDASEQTMMCAGVVIVAAATAILLLVFKEGRSGSATVYRDDLWKTSCHAVHPLWLLGLRCFAFTYSLAILGFDVAYCGVEVFYFYTQWSFLLLIAYFGMASLFSTKAALRNGLWRYTSSIESDNSTSLLKGLKNGDVEQNMSGMIATLKMYWETVFSETQQSASGFTTQIMFQTLAGSAVYTDVVYWLGVFPLLKEIPRSYDFLEVNLHGVNFVLIVTEMFLNGLSFPWFRGAYFTLFTGAYILFQWSMHALGEVEWWPYPFLDPTRSLAPVWYGLLCVGHVGCYGFMCLVAYLKHRLIRPY